MQGFGHQESGRTSIIGARSRRAENQISIASRGYAGTCIGALSKHILDGGNRCILYTDLGNPASIALYRRIGYRAVAEALRYQFE